MYLDLSMGKDHSCIHQKESKCSISLAELEFTEVLCRSIIKIKTKIKSNEMTHVNNKKVENNFLSTKLKSYDFQFVIFSSKGR